MCALSITRTPLAKTKDKKQKKTLNEASLHGKNLVFKNTPDSLLDYAGPRMLVWQSKLSNQKTYGEMSMAKTEIDDVSLDHLFVGIGRLNGDDDDTMHTIEAKDLGDASRIFERYMRESVQDFESEVCISEILSLENAIKARVSDSDINQHLDRDDVPDVSVVYERQPSPNLFRMVAPK